MTLPHWINTRDRTTQQRGDVRSRNGTQPQTTMCHAELRGKGAHCFGGVTTPCNH